MSIAISISLSCASRPLHDLVCFELATASRNVKYLLLNWVKTLDIWLISQLRNLTFVSQDYVFMKRDMNPIY
jgi:hypothetical protein